MALSTIEKVLFLKSVPLFDRIPAEELVGVTQIAQEVHFQARDVLIRQGEQGDCLYLIVDGEVDVVIEGLGIVNHLGSRGVLGETAILSDSPRTASCISTTEITALKIERDDFWELMGERPEIALGVIKVLIHQLGEFTRRFKGRDAAFMDQMTVSKDRPPD